MSLVNKLDLRMAMSSGETKASHVKAEVTDGNEEKEQSAFLVEFSNGRLKSWKNAALKYSCYKYSVRNSCSSKRILVAESSRLFYTGSNFESDLSKITSSVLKICMLNRKTASIKLLDADMFHLKPLLKCSDIVQTNEKRSYAEMSSDLTLAFGSKTMKKNLVAKQRYTTVNESTTSSIMDGILTVPLHPKKDIPSSESALMPPQNSSAVNVDEVYNLYDIISKEEYAALDSEAEIFLDAKCVDIDLWLKQNKFSTFILQYLKNNILSLNLHKAKLLCYFHYMFCILKTGYKDWRKKDPVPEVPEPFKQKLKDSFCIGRSMPARMKDKLLAYLIVLGLKLNNNVFNGSFLTSSANISGKRLVLVAHALGCHVSDKNGTQIIELKLPLFKLQVFTKRKKSLY